MIGGRGYSASAAAAAAEPVVRLEAGEDSFDARGVHEPLVEEAEDRAGSRGGKKRLDTRGATLMMAGGVLLLSLVAVVAILLKEKEVQHGGVDLATLGVERGVDDGTEMIRLVATVDEVTKGARDLLVKFYHTDSFDPAMARDPEDLKRLSKSRMQAAVLSGEEIEELIPMVGGSDDAPWLALTGRNREMKTVRYFFVHDEGRVLLDVGASFGMGEVPVPSLGDLSAEREVEMRMQVSIGNLYSSWFPEEEFQSLRLVVDDGDKPMWGYTRRGGAAHEQLMDFLKQDSMIFQREEAIAAILKLRRHAESPTALFEVTEVLHNGWMKL